MKRLRKGKSPGLERIPAELIQHSGKSVIKALHILCRKIWNTEIWSDKWKNQEFVVIHKSGSTKDCGNYRTIALISHASKILLTIILNRLQNKIEEKLPEEQAGFRKNRRTTDTLCIQQCLIEKTPIVAFIVFIDYAQACDSVSHMQLFETMTRTGFPKHLVTLLQQLHCDQKGVVKWNGTLSQPFQFLSGVRQGCVISPSLFSLHRGHHERC